MRQFINEICVAHGGEQLKDIRTSVGTWEVRGMRVASYESSSYDVPRLSPFLLHTVLRSCLPITNPTDTLGNPFYTRLSNDDAPQKKLVGESVLSFSASALGALV